MKMTEALKRASANMQPGVIASSGFLGSDQRSLADIIAADEASMTHLGLQWEALAARMRFLLQAGMTGLGEPTEVAGTWIIKVDETRGKIASPWEDGLCRKVNARVSIGDKYLIYNELSIFMAEKHHFLQGRGSPFRIEPDQALAVLFPPENPLVSTLA